MTFPRTALTAHAVLLVCSLTVASVRAAPSSHFMQSERLVRADGSEHDLNPPPPAPEGPAGPYTLDDSSDLGHMFNGMGAISGGGATSKLLYDYAEPARSNVLDYLFLPSFGASLHMLKVEMGGDADATEGSEPSHVHGPDDVPNFDRGYEWWLMKEAKARNPDIKLYGLPWAFPGWLDPKSTSTVKADANQFMGESNLTQIAEYVVEWVKGAKDHHGLHIDYVGKWNEKAVPDAYPVALRKVLDDNGLSSTEIVGGPHYAGSTLDETNCSVSSWKDAQVTNWVDEDGSSGGVRSAQCLARIANRQYINGCYTGVYQWHLVSSFYQYFDYNDCGLSIARSPWSGEFEVTSPTWTVAHTTQFSKAGWRYLGLHQGVGFLQHGGSYVTRTSVNPATGEGLGTDFSIVIEKDPDTPCVRGPSDSRPTMPENVTFVLRGALKTVKRWYVWRTNLGTSSVFEQQDDLVPVVQPDGSIAMTLLVINNDVITITSLSTGRKGNHTSPIAKPFPFPYTETFDKVAVYQAAPYFYDQMGAWEITDDSSICYSGRCMVQVATQYPICWDNDCIGPTTYFGDGSFMNANVAFKFRFAVDASLKIVINNPTQGAQLHSFSVNTDGSTQFNVTTNGALNSTAGRIAPFPARQWHDVSVTMHADPATAKREMSASINGQVVGTVQASVNGSDHENFPWWVVIELDRYVGAAIDDFRVEALKQD